VKIGILHYTAWPEFGGVESIIRDQALLLSRHGHQVLVLAGVGQEPEEGYTFYPIPEMAPDFPKNKSVRTLLNSGQVDKHFNDYRALLVAALTPYFQQVDVVLVHNIFTVHHNLALTQALHDLAEKFKIVTWAHDLSVKSSDYSLAHGGQKPPWSLMRQSCAKVSYVATSPQRYAEILAELKPTPDVHLIPPGVEFSRIFHFTLEMHESLPTLALESRDFVFLMPVRLVPRKNIEFALSVIARLQDLGKNPLLLITGAVDSHGVAAAQYADFLRKDIADNHAHHAVIVNDHFGVDDKILRDLYGIADCLFYPSKHEGLGLPLLEAALHRLPIWCSDVPLFYDTKGEGSFQLKELAQVELAVHWLEAQPSFRLRRQVRQDFNPDVLYQKHYVPLLGL
jgi:glycosyltransferase involved in cell wall biosynthesis